MRDKDINRMTLMAFADGELSPEDAAAVVIHLADYPEDQAYVDDLMASNVAIVRTYSEPISQAAPPRFEALILGDDSSPGALGSNIVSLKPRGVGRLFATGMVSAGLAIAATMSAISILPTGPAGVLVGPLATGAPLEQALTSTPTGTSVELAGDEEFAVLSTLRADNGAYCREFEVRSRELQHVQTGLACRQNETWSIDGIVAEFQPALPEPGATYAPASGDQAGLLEQWLERRGAADLLSSDEENRLLNNNWKP